MKKTRNKGETAAGAADSLVRLADFVENPENPQTVTDDNFARLVGKLRRVPEGLTAMRIAYVTDDPRFPGVGMVLSGNKRLRALRQIYGDGGEVPAAWFQDVTGMSAAERHEFIIDANVNEGEWDLEKLLEQYGAAELEDFGLEELLKDAGVGNTVKGGETDEDAVPDAPPTPISKRGEVYQLGEHRLMCGDSTNAEDVARLMGGERADMVFTDPPYNVSIGDRNKAINEEEKKRGQRNLGGRIETNILGDHGMTDEECGEKLWRPAFQNMADYSADHAAIYVTMPQGGTHMMMMMMMMMRGSWQVKHELMWLKNQPTFSMRRLDYDYKHEPICYGWKKFHRFFGNGNFTKSVWEYDKPNCSKLHPTMKPVALVENALLNSSQMGEVVMDLFGGSGTTAIAAEDTGRKARLMELDPHYCDVIRRRWAEFVHGEGCDWQSLTPKVDETA